MVFLSPASPLRPNLIIDLLPQVWGDDSPQLAVLEGGVRKRLGRRLRLGGGPVEDLGLRRGLGRRLRRRAPTLADHFDHPKRYTKYGMNVSIWTSIITLIPMSTRTVTRSNPAKRGWARCGSVFITLRSVK